MFFYLNSDPRLQRPWITRDIPDGFVTMCTKINSKTVIRKFWFLTTNCKWSKQGILSVLGIAGYEWVPARIGRFYKYKIFFFHNTNGQLKTGKTGTNSAADTSPVQCSLIKIAKIKATIEWNVLKIAGTFSKWIWKSFTFLVLALLIFLIHKKQVGV